MPPLLVSGPAWVVPGGSAGVVGGSGAGGGPGVKIVGVAAMGLPVSGAGAAVPALALLNVSGWALSGLNTVLEDLLCLDLSS